MERLKFLVIGILAITLAGCGQTIVETLNVPEAPGFDAPGKGRSVVILPFADYSNAGNLESAYRRNIAVTEALTDRLSANGFSMPVQEDVFQYLVNEGVINSIPYEETKSVSMVNELSNEWSDTMKSEIRRYIAEQNTPSAVNASSPGTHALTSNAVAKIGRTFKADYVLRGRILEYKSRQDPGWEPWKKGILPFINGGTSRILFGFASSELYDEWNSQITGAAYGARIGYEHSNWPWEEGDGESIFGMSSADDANAILWGSIGSEIGRQSYRSGDVDQAVVQLRVWVQEATSGNVIWTNRVDVKVSPESFFADNQYDALFNKAIEKGVTTLIDNFVNTSL